MHSINISCYHQSSDCNYYTVYIALAQHWPCSVFSLYQLQSSNEGRESRNVNPRARISSSIFLYPLAFLPSWHLTETVLCIQQIWNQYLLERSLGGWRGGAGLGVHIPSEIWNLQGLENKMGQGNRLELNSWLSLNKEQTWPSHCIPKE
jgi:hypothetical protein